jgi:molecular chaperone Hsp33
MVRSDRLADDVIRPFQIESSGLRGRLVRLGPLLEEILGRHDYPDRVARLLGETIVLTTLLASALKYEGVFTLQAQAKGAVRRLVADVTSDGAVRAQASFDPEALEAVEGTALPALMGPGHLAFTVDQGEDTERYQGIVDLAGDTVTDAARHYFQQSEQLRAGIVAFVDRSATGWRGGGIMLQQLPDAEIKAVPMDREDDWRRAMLLLETATAAEMLDPALDPERMLYRLYNEDGVRVWPAQPLHFACRCSRERVATMLASLPEDEIRELLVDGAVTVSCEFCNTAYLFDQSQIDAIYRGGESTTGGSHG